MNLDETTLAKVAHAGELLIRAAAVLGTLTAEQLETLRVATDGGLPDSIGFALESAKTVSPQIAEVCLKPPIPLQPIAAALPKGCCATRRNCP